MALDATDPTVITVASDDGFAADYQVAPDQAQGLRVGDVVTVIGLVSDDGGTPLR